MKKVIHNIGGGTFNYVRAHLALSAPAFGETAKKIAVLCEQMFNPREYEVRLHLTKMADTKSTIVTNNDVATLIDHICEDKNSKIVFMSAGLTDFTGTIGGVESGKHASRLKTREGTNVIDIVPAPKILSKIRNSGHMRKDIFLVAFKTTCNAQSEKQYHEGLNLLKSASVNLVLANDIGTKNNMIIVPEEAVYHESSDREDVLRNLVEMTHRRAGLHFTESRAVDDVMMPWSSPMIPQSFREVVEHCVKQGAYKAFRGANCRTLRT